MCSHKKNLFMLDQFLKNHYSSSGVNIRMEIEKKHGFQHHLIGMIL